MTMPAPPTISVAELLPELAGHRYAAVRVSGAQSDSRHLRAGELFVALKGSTTHGLRHAANVEAKHAAGILVDTVDLETARQLGGNLPLFAIPALADRMLELAGRLYAEAFAKLALIGVTGTNGKTSCCRLLESALESLGTDSGYIGTLGWGRGERLNRLQHTTPDLLCTYRILADLARQGRGLWPWKCLLTRFPRVAAPGWRSIPPC